ncbi:hypothetical protein VF21_01190 [Pseudogymnoascus sp. 05NY08]|nr:hypothetical protein VF21_01190 [Pseudogymnoascus sp. 05NY08]
MRPSLYSISVGLYLFHTVLGGSVTFEGPESTRGAVATCTSDNNDDETIADYMEMENLGFIRAGNNFITLDPYFTCDPGSISAIKNVCESPDIGGVVTCVKGEM